MPSDVHVKITLPFNTFIIIPSHSLFLRYFNTQVLFYVLDATLLLKCCSSKLEMIERIVDGLYLTRMYVLFPEYK